MWERYSILEEAVWAGLIYHVDPLDFSWGRGNKIILNSYNLNPVNIPVGINTLLL